jgi:hypothetical protein
VWLLPSPVNAQSSASGLRSFDSLFPGLGAEVKSEVFGERGFIRSIAKKMPLEIVPAPGSGIDLRSAVMRTNPSYLVESLMVVPYTGRTQNRLDAYNALRQIRDLKGRLYSSHSKGDTPLFEDATRLESAQKNNPIPDPPPAASLPSSETMYIRLKDTNFGNSFYRGNISVSQYGVTCNLTNYKNLTYLFLTVMKEERFSAILYMEPLVEGMLVYSMAGAEASDFIANRVDIPSAIRKRLAVFIDWAADGIRAAR